MTPSSKPPHNIPPLQMPTSSSDALLWVRVIPFSVSMPRVGCDDFSGIEGVSSRLPCVVFCWQACPLNKKIPFVADIFVVHNILNFPLFLSIYQLLKWQHLLLLS